MRVLATLIILVLPLVSTEAQAGDRNHTQPWYSIQVRAVPLAEADDALATARELRENGYLTYTYMTEIDGARWLRVAVGAFANRGDAAEFGRAFERAENNEYFVAAAPIRVLAASGERDFVITPSALWVRGGAGDREVFAFAAEAPNGGDLPDAILPEPSPDGEAVAFIYDSHVYVATIDGDGARRLTDPGAPYVSADADYRWRLGWSPSSRYVTFLDQAYWEYPIGLWLARADGSALRCLACNRDGQSAVRWFVWHPEEDRVLFVEGFAMGTIAVGGGLFSGDPDGTVHPVEAATRGEREEIAGPLGIEDVHLTFRRVRHDADFMDRTITEDRLPIDAL